MDGTLITEILAETRRRELELMQPHLAEALDERQAARPGLRAHVAALLARAAVAVDANSARQTAAPRATSPQPHAPQR